MKHVIPQLFEQAPFSLQVVDLCGKTIHVNQAWKDLWKLPEPFLRDFILKEYNIFEDPILLKQNLVGKLANAAKGKVETIDPFHYNPADIGLPGTARWIGATVFPIRDEEGKVHAFALAHSDFTQEKKNENRLNDALETGQMAWWELDLTTNEVTRSKDHDRLYGYSEGLPTWSLDIFRTHVHPDDENRVMDNFHRMYQENLDSFSADFRVRWPDQSVHWLNSRARFIRDSTGKAVALRGTLVDVTSLKEATDARDQFLSIASHELKTPLTTISLQLDLMLRNLKVNQFKVEHVGPVVGKLKKQTKRLVHLIEDMLNIAQIATGKLSLHLQDVDLVELVHDVVEQVSPQMESSKCTVKVNAPASLMVACDPFRIEQVLLNLLSNAMKYAPGSEISILMEMKENEVHLQLSDTGPGIPEEDHARVFERFERGPSVVAGGLGLGLFIARHIMEMHSGTISLVSKPGKGTTFLLGLPHAENRLERPAGL